jgi:hypothetical protein
MSSTYGSTLYTDDVNDKKGARAAKTHRALKCQMPKWKAN